MQKAKLSWLFILNICLIVVLVISLAKPSSVKSALSTHVVISEVQVGGATAADEFVELYNPTGSPVNLAGWRLTRKTQSGATEETLANSLTGSIPANGFFLVAPAVDYTGSTAADQNYSTASRIAADNSVILYSDAGTTVVDKVGMGTATDVETTATTSPSNGSSVERKANSGSTQSSMLAGDASSGNGEDTDNNSNDFVPRDVSQPQNASSLAETPTASPSPSESPSSSPSEEPSPSPSEEPSPSPSPSEEPSPSPSVEPSPSPSIEPSPSPSVEPSPSPSPSVSPSPSASVAPSASPSVSPSVSPSPSPSPEPTTKPKKRLSCSFEVKTFHFGRWTFTWPILSCHWTLV